MISMILRALYGLSVLALCFAGPATRRVPDGHRQWSAYNGGPEQIHYSTLARINRSNVSKLRVAWTYDTGEAGRNTEMQCNPIIANRMLYATTPKLRVIALDAASGRLKWSFDPNEGKEGGRARNRGLTYWTDGKQQRIFAAARHYLYSVDALTGKPAAGFGEGGRIDLRENLGRDIASVVLTVTSPGIIYKDTIIMGSLVPEGLPSSPGDVRAYDVHTGKLRWSFHTIPHPGEPGFETWPKDAWTYSGGANNWAGMSLDEKRGLVFVPTGSASFDFYGANRAGNNLYANCLLALNAENGRMVWYYQTVRHDLWDRDLPAPPSLVTVMRNGRLIDAVAQITKSGFVFVFDRVTGTPLFPIEEREVASSEVDGEWSARKQPLPVKPAPFARQAFTPEMATTRTPKAHQAVLDRLRALRSNGQFVPPSFEGTVIFPGFDGGGEWGGASFDPETGLLYVNSNEMPWILRLVPRAGVSARMSGQALYERNCASCHRSDLSGNPPEFPSLVDVGKHLTSKQISETIRLGAGRMPEFAHLREPAIGALTSYLLSGKSETVAVDPKPASPIDQKYAIDGYNKFLDPDGYPAVRPPWGTLNAINLDTGEYAWKIPFGEIPALAKDGMTNTGSENYGGAVVTAGGLLFIGATNFDHKFRAYDKLTGKLLWQADLPAAGNATPATYEVNGKQYVVIAAGGGKSGNPSGGSYVAFALPE
jgi:quinoprotein glucose dehydrogenase